MAPGAPTETTEKTAPDMPERPSFREAYEAAQRAHADPAAAGSAEVDTEEKAGAETAHPENSGGIKEKAVEEKPAAKGKVETDAKPGEDTSLLSETEFTALQTKHVNDPAALRKALEGAFTKKTQALSEERRSYERLKPYGELIEAYERDTEGTLRALAKANGFDLVAPGVAQPADKVGTAETVDTVLDEFRTELGPELEYLADGLAPAIRKMVERLTKTTVDQATEPLRKHQETLLGQQAQETTAHVMTELEARHPDWKDHEDRMFDLSQKLSPKGMTEGEYLDYLYTIATAEPAEARQKTIDAKVAEGVKAAVKKMQKGADEHEERPRETPEGQVKIGRPEGRAATFSEAYQAAKRGERW